MGRFFVSTDRSLSPRRRPWQTRAVFEEAHLPSAEFWYEFASTYSYPAALRVAELADERGVSLVWRPFLLGPIFFAQGWRDSPFNVYPAKGRYMWRDLERTCGAMGVPLKRPEPFPQPSLLAARVALALEDPERSDFSRRVFVAEFGEGLPIGDRATLGALLEECGVEPAATFERAQGHANKARLKAECARATEIGIFGAPCLVTADGEVFWGNDRLEQGLDWAAGAGVDHTP
jgi:2-hydroxychromene-2-carboxylate isomerase